jgi:hypothetical protein
MSVALASIGMNVSDAFINLRKAAHAIAFIIRARKHESSPFKSEFSKHERLGNKVKCTDRLVNHPRLNLNSANMSHAPFKSEFGKHESCPV